MEDPSNIRMIDDEKLKELCPRAGTFTADQVRKVKYVKVMLTEDGHSEHVWITVDMVLPFDTIGTWIIGRITNSPVALQHLKGGDTVSKRLEEVEEIWDEEGQRRADEQ